MSIPCVKLFVIQKKRRFKFVYLYGMSMMIFRYLFAARFRFRCTECSYRNLIIRIIVLYNNNCAWIVSLVCKLQKMISLELEKKKIKKLNHDLNQMTKTIFSLNRDLINDVKIKNVENNLRIHYSSKFFRRWPTETIA